MKFVEAVGPWATCSSLRPYVCMVLAVSLVSYDGLQQGLLKLRILRG